jgi:hypothetical protein
MGSRVHFLAAVAVIVVTTSFARAVVNDVSLLGRSGAGMRFDNENPTASGSGTGGEIGSGIIYDDISNLLTINVGWGSGKGFTDLTGNVIAAHIHQASSPAFTDSGPVIINLDGATPGFNNSGTNGGWTNTQVTLSAAQETQLFAGTLYLNAHTNANSGGEIRGNMIVPEPASATLLLAPALLLLRRKRRIG